MPHSQLRHSLQAAYDAAKQVQAGNVATYIPELAGADPATFALAVCTSDGDLQSLGESTHLFSQQSLCKPFLYGAALMALGRDAVHQHVGVEPTGEAFNSFIRLESSSHLPHNPMINAGAISICALLCEHFDAGWLLDLFRSFVGRNDVHLDMPVYLSEKGTADRNRAIAFLLRYFGGLGAPVDDVLDLYFQACAIDVTTEDLAVMGATLANFGTNPRTGKQVLEPWAVSNVLTVMTTCGMYDGSGRFFFDIGLPAKSGVSGGLLVISPGRYAIASFAPRLNEHGNSVRGIEAVARLSESLGIHACRPHPRPAMPPQAPLEALLQEVLSEAHAIDPLDASPVGVSICTVEGDEIHGGDTETPFPLQAVGNAFTYTLALETHGLEVVHQLVGVEPSGNRFDAVLFDADTQRPHNPLGNAGAIAMASLVPPSDQHTQDAARLKNLLAWLSDLAGVKELPVDAGVLANEQRLGDRNRAIAHLLKNYGVIQYVDPALNLYFQQCSTLVTCAQVARMGATLANGGTHPLTGKQLTTPDNVQHTLSVMFMTGLHDHSGRFAFDVGVPAKSGASGGIVAVVPGRCGIAVYSPEIDLAGTSTLGAHILQRVARALGAGIFEVDVEG